MSDYGDVADKLRDYKHNLKDEHDRKTRESMQSMRNAVSQKLIQNDSVARNVLIRDIRRSKRELSGSFTAHSVHAPDWAKYLEYGTGSRARTDTEPNHEQYPSPDGWADIGAIETWIVAKNITPQYYDTQSDLARAIARTIGEIGTFPHPFMRPVWFNNSTGYQTVIDANMEAFTTAWRRSR